MIIDPLDGVAVFLAVAEHRSFTGAALALAVTPTAVSKAIRALEARQGVMLFQRTTRRVALTEAGQAVFVRLRPAVSEISDAFAALGGFRDRPMGTLRITAPHGAVEPILGALVPAFRRAHPEVTLEISLDEAIVDLVGAGFDAGIRLGEAVDAIMRVFIENVIRAPLCQTSRYSFGIEAMVRTIRGSHPSRSDHGNSRLGDTAPNFTQDSSEGPLDFYQWAGDSWVVFFSHPADFTPVCTTELGKTAALSGEFAKRGVKPIALSVDPGHQAQGMDQRHQRDAEHHGQLPHHCGRRPQGGRPVRPDPPERLGHGHGSQRVHHRPEEGHPHHHHLPGRPAATSTRSSCVSSTRCSSPTATRWPRP
jgi:DNA-binding transcriptional LysR family regulator